MISLAQKVGTLAAGSSIALGSYALSKPLLLEPEARRDKLPIYPIAQPEIILVEEHSALEEHIAAGREGATSAFSSVRDVTQGVVSKVVAAERRTINKVNSLIPEDEALNPGALWVVVATLSGSIFARNRNILLRLALPPAIFFTALPTFLPKLSENLSNEISGQTLRIAPELHAQVAELRKSVRDSTASVRETYGSSVATVKTHVLSGVESIEDKTGLQLRQAFREAQKQSSPASAVSQATKEVVDPSAGQIAIGSTPSRQVTVPLYGQHAERQVIPGTNAQVASTAADSRPTEVLAVPVHTQVGGSSRTVQERADSLAAEGLAKLEREAERALGKVEEKAGEAKAMAERKAAEVKEAAKDSLSAAKEIVQEKAGEVKEAANTPVVAPAPPQDKGVVTPTGIFADRPTGYKKFV